MTTVLTDAGVEWCVDRLVGAGGNSALDGHFLAWGIGAGTAGRADTALFTETGSRVAGTLSKYGTGQYTEYQVTGTLTALSSITVTNAGNFTESSGGVLLVKGDFPGIALTAGQSLNLSMAIGPG